MIDYKVVIPSYKRASTITKKTLETLKICKILPEKIYIFVANQEEYEIYKKEVPPELYNEIIIGVETLHKQRNFIRNYFPNNDHLFMMDDDIEGFYIKKGDKLVPYFKLNDLIKFGFSLCHKFHTTLCGIYPVHNAYFMKNTISVGLYFVVGCCYWNINKRKSSLNLTLEEKEDYERNIKEYLDNGTLVRLNNITVKTNYYTEPGGMQLDRNDKRITQSAMYLLKNYPDFVELNKARKKHTEIRFKRQKNNTSFKL